MEAFNKNWNVWGRKTRPTKPHSQGSNTGHSISFSRYLLPTNSLKISGNRCDSPTRATNDTESPTALSSERVLVPLADENKSAVRPFFHIQGWYGHMLSPRPQYAREFVEKFYSAGLTGNKNQQCKFGTNTWFSGTDR